MDTTTVSLKALQDLQSQNDSVSQEELDAAREEGARDAAISIERGELFMLMDETSIYRRQNAYAVGWNNEWTKAA